MTIGSAVVLIFEHDHIARKLKLDQFPYTRDEWHKYIFWPVHANGGNYPSDPRANTAPYAQLATKMRAGGKPEHQSGSTLYPRTTKNHRGTWSLTQPPRTAPSATSSTSTSVCIVISVSAYHHAKTEASVSIINCADDGTNASLRFAHPRFVSVYESTTRRINARRTNRTLKCSLVERPSQLFAYAVAR